MDARTVLRDPVRAVIPQSSVRPRRNATFPGTQEHDRDLGIINDGKIRTAGNDKLVAGFLEQATVASCRLPLGKPSLSMIFSVVVHMSGQGPHTRAF